MACRRSGQYPRRALLSDSSGSLRFRFHLQLPFIASAQRRLLCRRKSWRIGNQTAGGASERTNAAPEDLRYPLYRSSVDTLTDRNAQPRPLDLSRQSNAFHQPPIRQNPKAEQGHRRMAQNGSDSRSGSCPAGQYLLSASRLSGKKQK